MTNKYRKKPVIIEAMEFTYPPTSDFLDWLGVPAKITKTRYPNSKAELEIPTLEDGHDGRAKHVATEGDYIIRGVKGELYPCKPDIFNATYEAE